MRCPNTWGKYDTLPRINTQCSFQGLPLSYASTDPGQTSPEHASYHFRSSPIKLGHCGLLCKNSHASRLISLTDTHFVSTSSVASSFTSAGVTHTGPVAMGAYFKKY